MKERKARYAIVKHDLAGIFHCSPLDLDDLPHKTIEEQYAIMKARDQKSRTPPPSDG
jgi:hypothetical protein